ncbi:MAG TPA: TIGR01620 family protein [Geminicoccus sp.]|jgi:putative membrane protein|uniref:TIGR01620 family protein n=1 Tax=Geminicoccus sp. TaxID=2024832 RepID=UPI002E322DCA|nr:TIGR01620 family protein [Geminicoccus sp.]HEX2526125.1 TIGR01620 family protein [Geminicoccus sp.]
MTDRGPIRPFELKPDDPRVGSMELVPEPATADETAELIPDPPVGKTRRGAAFWFRVSIALLVVTVLLGQFVLWVRDLTDASPWLAGPLGALAVVAAVTGTALAWRGVRRWHSLDERAELRARIGRLSMSDLHGEGPARLREVSDLIKPVPGMSATLARFEAQASDALSDGERVQLFERVVLTELDERAVRIVGMSARDIAVLTAVTPTGLLDALVVLTRTFAMLQRLAGLYGVPPDRMTVIRLMRVSFRNAAMAGAADVLTHATTEHLGASFMSILSAKAGQGAGNALLAGRLGLQAIQLLRPLPFVTKKPPRLIDLRGMLGFDLTTQVEPGRIRQAERR